MKVLLVILIGVLIMLATSFVYSALITPVIWFLWNWLVPIYFPFMPQQYLQIPFWHVFGLIIFVSMVRNILLGDSLKSKKE